MKSMKILIVEDEILIAEDLKDNLVSFGHDTVEMAHNKKDAIALVQTYDPDLVLLDVRMENERDGIDIGEYISANFQKPFIYITAHSDVNMVKEIVKTKPAGYITKPVKKSDLFAAISLVSEQLAVKENNVFKIKDGYSTVIIPIDSIIYVESEGNYVNIFCDEKKYVARQSLESIIDELPDSNFFRIHRSYLINIKKVSKFSRKEVDMGKIVLPISRNLADDFTLRMNQ